MSNLRNGHVAMSNLVVQTYFYIYSHVNYSFRAAHGHGQGGERGHQGAVRGVQGHHWHGLQNPARSGQPRGNTISYNFLCMFCSTFSACYVQRTVHTIRMYVCFVML